MPVALKDAVTGPPVTPATLLRHLGEPRAGGTMIVDVDEFDERSLMKAGTRMNPLEDGSPVDHRVHEVGLTSLTLRTLELGLVSWVFSLSVDATARWLREKLAKPKRFDVTTFQAEDEIAASASAIGAALGGSLAVTAS